MVPQRQLLNPYRNQMILYLKCFYIEQKIHRKALYKRTYRTKSTKIIRKDLDASGRGMMVPVVV